jgi:ADP-L-glycero-D-manno-heptose 6-epimerase
MIVVTGGAGFIGSNLVAGLEARGAREIVVCDRLDSGAKWRNLAKRELADLVPPERLTDLLDANKGRIEAVFHMGAISATTAADVDVLIENNIRATLTLWAWCAANRVRLIYASSAATYGDGAQGFDDDSASAALARLKPMNPYGWSKHFVDRRIARLVAENGPRPPQHAGLKFFNVYGPHEYHKDGQISVALKVFREIEDGGSARLFKSYREGIADGAQQRDFIWVGDCVAAMLWLYDRPAVSGLFNLGTGKARSFADVARAVFAALGRKPEIRYVEMPEQLRGAYQYFTQAEMKRLRAAGYDRPFTELEDGVARYVRDHLATPDPYL